MHASVYVALILLYRGVACSASSAGHAGLRQILAVDVLTGKSKEMQADSSMRNAPKIEDESVGRLVCCSYRRGVALLSHTCDSMCQDWDGHSMACCRKHEDVHHNRVLRCGLQNACCLCLLQCYTQALIACRLRSFCHMQRAYSRALLAGVLASLS